jgi:hypothetical protein
VAPAACRLMGITVSSCSGASSASARDITRSAGR